jgi:NADH-quinone oxidoreductase subunit G
MELGMANRGEHSEIETFLGASVNSELSGNMIDICPVGALTSKPFRYSARTWEMSRRKSVSPHDSTGANLVVQVKNHKVMRVVPFENEAVNECWIADRDRFSYEALNSTERLTKPMLKQGGDWIEVDWPTALEYVANGLKQISTDHGAASLGLLASPHSTVEELYLAGKLMRGLGSFNVDYRLRHACFDQTNAVRWLGRSIASLSMLDRVLVVGSNLRKDHPLFAQRVRQAVRHGAKVFSLSDAKPEWAMAVEPVVEPSPTWVLALARLAAAVAGQKGISAPSDVVADERSQAVAASLLTGNSKAILLGNAAAHHEHASSLLTLANWLAIECGATVGYLTEAANTVGAQLVGVLPGAQGANVHDMVSGQLKALLLLGCEPLHDIRGAQKAVDAIAKAQLVVTLSAFKSNMDCSDVLLPIAPFTETPGSFVNAEGRLQSFHAVVKPLGDARPAWKVLRVLANTLSLSGFEQQSVADVLAQALPGIKSGEFIAADKLGGVLSGVLNLAPAETEPCVASIYALDGLVRRAAALQSTRDGRLGVSVHQGSKA